MSKIVITHTHRHLAPGISTHPLSPTIVCIHTTANIEQNIKASKT